MGPETVQRVMECVHLILRDGSPPPPSGSIQWIAVLRTVVRIDFLRRVRLVDVEELRGLPTLVDYICRQYLSGTKALRPDRVRRASRAVVAFFGWTVGLLAEVLNLLGDDKVGGAEARTMLLKWRRERLAAAKARREAARQEALRLERERLEAERLEREQLEAERKEVEKLEAERLEKERKEKKKKKRETEEEVAPIVVEEEEEEEPVEEEEEPEEEEPEEPAFTPNMGFWDLEGNPERAFLEVENDTLVHIPRSEEASDAKVTCCNVLTREPIRKGVHHFEFVLHRVGGECWCGLTTDPAQGGMRISGWNLRGWTYYTRKPGGGRNPPALHVNKKEEMPFSRILVGDRIGLLVDVDRRGIAFLRNGELEGVCSMLPRTRAPLYLITHLGAPGDRVELCVVPIEDADDEAVEELERLLADVVPPSP